MQIYDRSAQQVSAPSAPDREIHSERERNDGDNNRLHLIAKNTNAMMII